MWTDGLRIAVLLIAAAGAFWAPPPVAAADWQARERACRAQCPSFPRFGGVETDAQYRERMRLQAAYDRCFLKCAHRTSSGFAPSFTPIDEAAKAYYRRNGVRMGN